MTTFLCHLAEVMNSESKLKSFNIVHVNLKKYSEVILRKTDAFYVHAQMQTIQSFSISLHLIKYVEH